MSRKLYNTAIVEKLKELVNKHPDLRFGQILINADIIQVVPNEFGVPIVDDPFYEEPEITWERVKNSKFAFKELFN